MEGEGRHNIENLQIMGTTDYRFIYFVGRALEPNKIISSKTYVKSCVNPYWEFAQLVTLLTP